MNVMMKEILLPRRALSRSLLYYVGAAIMRFVSRVRILWIAEFQIASSSKAKHEHTRALQHWQNQNKQSN